MINTLSMKGFKSMLDRSLNLNRLTVLTGLNSSGKSTVIQAIRMLDQAHKSRNVFLDGYGDAFELKNPNAKDGFIISALLDNSICDFSSIDNSIHESVEFPNVIYVSAGRFGPQVSVQQRNDYLLGENGENIFKVIDKYSDEILPEIIQNESSQGLTLGYNLEAWLKTISPDVRFSYENSSLSDSSYSIFNGHRSKNVGFGLSYVLPVIVSLLISSIIPNSLVLIENPEAHLHPRGQTEIAKLIAKAVESGSQAIIETHSDHIFDGLRIYAKNSSSFSEHMKSYWFEIDENANSRVEEVIVDKNGRVAKWPKGMFDQFELNALELL